jgi:hypothetical protein
MVWDEGKYQFLGIVDTFSILFWIILLISIINTNRQNNISKSHYRYYKPAFYIKFFSALIFSIIYISFYAGGDSTAYWDTAQKLNNLFWLNPNQYFNEMFNSSPDRARFISFAIETTGLPPNWIYKEDEAWFAAKVFSLLTFITFRSYFAMTMICAYISFRVSWKLFELALVYKVCNERNAAIGALFLPSTCFWCTGITKDMLVYSAVIYLLIQLFTFLNPDKLKKERKWVIMIICVFLILNIRDFMLVAAFGPFFLALASRWAKKQSSSVSQWFIMFSFISILVILMLNFLGSEKGQEFAQEAEVIQQDLKWNSTYTGNKYDLGISDFTPAGMLRAMPISIFTSFYRPFLWDGGSLFVRISAIEAFIFLIISIRFILFKNIFRSLRQIKDNELLIASLVFALILGFFAGYTSGLFGVLVRFKAPLLPFLFLVLMYKKQEEVVEIDTKV